MKIKEYKLLSSIWEDDLNKQVNELIRKGYQPHGSPFVDSITLITTTFYQAVVKYDESSEGIPNDKM